MAKKDVAKKDSSGTKEKAGTNKDKASSLQATKFAQETKEELDKIVWPSRQQLISESAAVMLMVTLVATVIYLVDNFFSWAQGVVF